MSRLLGAPLREFELPGTRTPGTGLRVAPEAPDGAALAALARFDEALPPAAGDPGQTLALPVMSGWATDDDVARSAAAIVAAGMARPSGVAGRHPPRSDH